MEALNFLRFWRPTSVSTLPAEIPDPIVVIDDVSDEEEEEEESYFELEITSPDFDNKENTNTNTNTIVIPEVTQKQLPKNSTKIAADEEPKILQSLSIPSNEFLSKRKILPIEPTLKPQSPIALLKSAPSFRVFNFKKAKSMPTQRTEQNRGKRRSLSLKFKLEDESNVPKLARENSVKSKESRSLLENQRKNVSSFDDPSNSKGFSKDLVQKYLNLLKPLYEKVSKKQAEKTKFSGDASPEMSPAKGDKRGVRLACNHLSKIRSSPAVVGPSSPAVRRRDDSLLQELDGIQGAILHCKRSFNASTDFEMDFSRKSAEQERASI